MTSNAAPFPGEDAPIEPLDADVAQSIRLQAEAGLADLFGPAPGPDSRLRAEEARRRFYPAPRIAVGKVVETIIDGPGGALPLQITWPASGAPKATVVFYHGGAWVVGSPQSHAAHTARIANGAQAVVVSVDYRLAPEHPFPAAVDDAMAALRWAFGAVAALGGDPTRVAVAGDSAGGNLAAVAALLARDEELPLAAQFLIYASTDMRGTALRAPLCYIGANPEVVAADPRVSPITALTHEKLAPAVIAVGMHDRLYARNRAYAQKLHEAGVEVVWRAFPSLGHSFVSQAGISETARQASDLIIADFARILSR